ncbi:glycosyltransferase [Sphingomonas sp. CL5.1]|uniref:glycosyltransferase n=1 Tax=Sphingomonas sp. CL5.1 TaxID=2653203 RepID=UPI001583818C|nr:glycosyltransferase [Sphingomonas sp. CL5.1]QKR99438.1 glycosyltransferase [Sphingomonas sp. CL5.1]
MSAALGIVVIGRNEGERLVRCLASIGRDHPVVYVDSGSTDDSVVTATRAGARIVALDMSTPFTAARARNAGRAALGGQVTLVQFVDGDCTLDPAWLDHAQAALAADGGLAAVFGRRREIRPEASRYNWLCDVEWAVPPGEVRYCGGDVMIRADALDAAGGYPDEMIAGEEPDLSIRMRASGWRIACLPYEMTRHDAAITRFGQWWRRAVRSGHAYAELAARHRGSPLQDYGHRLRGVLFWGGLLPVAAFVLLLSGAILRQSFVALCGCAVLMLPVLQFVRITRRERSRRPMREALTIAAFLMLAKPAQTLGALRYAIGRIGGRGARIIEYKGAAA